MNEDEVVVHWTAPESGVSQISQYDIRYRPVGGGWIQRGTSGTTTSLTVESLTPSTTYEFQVIARNSAGWSGWSPSGTVTTDARNEYYPITVTVSRVGNDPNLLGVDWTPFNARVEKFEIRYRGAGDATVGNKNDPRDNYKEHWRGVDGEVGAPWHVSPGSGTRYVIERPPKCGDTIQGYQCSPNGLGTFFVQVRPWIGGRAGAWSASGQGDTPDCRGHCGPPNRPNEPTVRTSGNGSTVDVSWRRPSSVEDIRNYEVRWRRAGVYGSNDLEKDKGWTTTPPEPLLTETSIQLGAGQIVPGTPYEFQVRARTVWWRWSPWSPTAIGGGSIAVTATAGFQSGQPFTCPGGIEERTGAGATPKSIDCLKDTWTATDDFPVQPAKDVIGWGITNNFQEDVRLVHNVDVNWIDWAQEANAPSATLSPGEQITVHPRWTEAARHVAARHAHGDVHHQGCDPQPRGVERTPWT